MTAIQYPDGVAADGRVKFLPPQLAPELLLPEETGNDETWVADNATRAPGLQPITSTNPDGDYPGIPLAELGKSDDD